MKICIISDLHCKHQSDVKGVSETLLFSNMPRKPISHHPVVAMLNLIENDHTIEADVLLCLGDLGDKADEQGIISAWSFTEEIRQRLKASIKIGIPGNHDINSRKENGKEAFSFIKDFHENYPTLDEQLNAQFWSNGFCVQTCVDSLFLLINTVHDHDDAKKAQKANIRNVAIEDIRSELSRDKYSKIKYKICMLHHHPIKHSNILNYNDTDSLENGDELIDLLNVQNFDIVVHGHKHQPRIVEYNGMPILASGSFSSFANLQASGFHTMFHIVELSKEKLKAKGFIFSWEYNVKDGWKKSYNAKFPPKIGFGSDIDLNDAASKINDMLVKNMKPIIYEDVLALLPTLEYITPDKLIRLGEILKKDYKLTVSPEYPLQPNIVTIIK